MILYYIRLLLKRFAIPADVVVTGKFEAHADMVAGVASGIRDANEIATLSTLIHTQVRATDRETRRGHTAGRLFRAHMASARAAQLLTRASRPVRCRRRVMRRRRVPRRSPRGEARTSSPFSGLRTVFHAAIP